MKQALGLAPSDKEGVRVQARNARCKMWRTSHANADPSKEGLTPAANLASKDVGCLPRECDGHGVGGGDGQRHIEASPGCSASRSPSRRTIKPPYSDQVPISNSPDIVILQANECRRLSRSADELDLQAIGFVDMHHSSKVTLTQPTVR